MKKHSGIFLVALAAILIGSQQSALADSSTPVKVITSKTYYGNRTIQYQSGATDISDDLWKAKIPTKISMKKDYSGYLSGKVVIKFQNIAPSDEGKDVRIEVALWTSGGKKVNDRTLYDWSPVSDTTTFDFPIYSFDEIKKGKYIWVITTYNYQYSGEGVIKVPVTFQQG
jgi:hypothetical protein